MSIWWLVAGIILAFIGLICIYLLIIHDGMDEEEREEFHRGGGI